MDTYNILEKGKFFLKGSAITPNAPPQLRHWMQFQKVYLSLPEPL